MTIDSLPTTLNSAILHTLLRHKPPNQFSTHLEDIINGLMEALEQGELHLSLDNTSKPEGLKAAGWPTAHKEALLSSGWLEGSYSPIVLIDEKICWRRWYEEMDEIIQELIKRSRRQRQIDNMSNTSRHLSPCHQLDFDQQSAVEAISKSNVILISGGPGTGKTSTIVKMLERALAINPSLTIGLAAPTGKASRKLQISIQNHLQNIESPYKRNLSSIHCCTIHSWLQARPGGFKRNKQNVLTVDLLVVDEMSMVDLELMKALLLALPSQSQLVLVGDPNQLPPIGSGAIWHHLQNREIRSRFNNGAIHLNKLYRNNGAIASTSKILREQNLDNFWEQISLLPTSSNIQQHICTQDLIPVIVLEKLRQHQNHLNVLAESFINNFPSDIESASINNTNCGLGGEKLLSHLEELMVLCPKKHGLWGVNHIHKALLGDKLGNGLDNWLQGTPVMCNQNQPELGLANGDIGIVIGEGENCRFIFRIAVEQQEVVTRLIHPTRLKTIQPALAMTIHKAQGSEADTVILLWPETKIEESNQKQVGIKSQSFEKRLIYTAITRARNKLHIVKREILKKIDKV